MSVHVIQSHTSFNLKYRLIYSSDIFIRTTWKLYIWLNILYPFRLLSKPRISSVLNILSLLLPHLSLITERTNVSLKINDIF